MYKVRLVVSKFPASGPYKLKDIERPDLPYIREDIVPCDGHGGRVVGRQLPDDTSQVAVIFIELTHRDDYEKIAWTEVSSLQPIRRTT